jgi:Tfp pilus assembly PilM family ATPase
MRRVLAIDAGSRRIKLLLAESDFGRVRIRKEDTIDLVAEGLVSAEEIQTHLKELLAEWGDPPVAMVLPQHLAVSQVVDLPQSPEAEVRKQIANETVKLSGVSESRFVYDFVRIGTPSQADARQKFWVTFAQEGDIRERITRFGLEDQDISDITTTANALIAAYRASNPLGSKAVLVHLGAQTTVVVVVVAGQGTFASSFQMGSDFFARALARQLGCAEEKAETIRASRDLFSGPDASREFAAVVDGWAAELKRQLDECFDRGPAAGQALDTFELIGSGGGLQQPGLREYLARHELGLNVWPAPAQPELAKPGEGMEVAFGTALQALGCSAQPVSLLPEEFRAVWKRRLLRQRLDFASVGLAGLCAVIFLLATWYQVNLIRHKQALLEKVIAGKELVEANQALNADLAAQYDMLRPVFAARQTMVDTLSTMALLQQSRSNRSFWYVVLADQQSYFSLPPAPPSTNRVVRTNLLSTLAERARPAPLLVEYGPQLPSTNSGPAKPGYIAELCIPDDAETTRRTLRELVSELEKSPVFSRVDLLSDDLRRNLADPKLILPERNFVLALDFARTEFDQPIPRKAPSRLAPRRTGPVYGPPYGPTRNEGAASSYPTD